LISAIQKNRCHLAMIPIGMNAKNAVHVFAPDVPSHEKSANGPTTLNVLLVLLVKENPEPDDFVGVLKGE